MCPREDGDVPEPQPTTEWRFSTSPRTDQPALPCGGKGGCDGLPVLAPGDRAQLSAQSPERPLPALPTSVTLRAVAFQPGTTSSLDPLLRLGPGPLTSPD